MTIEIEEFIKFLVGEHTKMHFGLKYLEQRLGREDPTTSYMLGKSTMCNEMLCFIRSRMDEDKDMDVSDAMLKAREPKEQVDG